MRSVLIRVNPWPEVLELSRVFLGPALDNNLLVGIELDRIASLAVEIAKKALAGAAGTLQRDNYEGVSAK